MRLRAFAFVVVSAGLLLCARANATEAADPLFCVETNGVWVGPLGPLPRIDYNPPDPCVL